MKCIFVFVLYTSQMNKCFYYIILFLSCCDSQLHVCEH